MRYLTLLLLLGMTTVLSAQVTRNPFELEARLPATESVVGSPAPTGNPFDLKPAAVSDTPTSAAPATAPGNAMNGTSEAARQDSNGGPIVIQSANPNQGKGATLTIHLLLLLGLSGMWLVFGGFLRQCLEGVVNDSLMTQLYTRRSGGELGAMWACYLFAIFAIGFYLHLLADSAGLYFAGFSIWLSWLTCSLIVAAVLGCKNLLIGLYARLFPVRKEAGHYLFTLMIFSILAGVAIVPVNLLISYAPEAWRATFVSLGGIVLVIAYSLHLLRGLLISGKHLISRPVHILLYICAVEIAPLFVAYRFLSDSIA